MPSIRLKFAKNWYDRIQEAADLSGQSTEQFLQGLIAMSVPPPRRKGCGRHLPRQEALIRQVTDLCRALDKTRGQVVEALDNIARQPRRKARIVAERDLHMQRLQAALKRKGVTHAQAAAYLGVSRMAVTKVVQGYMSLPPAWLEPLEEYLGKDWLDERVDR